MAEYDLQSIAFPTLDEAQIAELGRCTSDFKFHVIRSGEVEIIDFTGDKPKTLTVHRKGGFDVSHLTGNPSMVGAVWTASAVILALFLRHRIPLRPTAGPLAHSNHL
jgi:thioredoxin reductase (NADPH)